MIQGVVFHKGRVLSKDVNSSIPLFDRLSIFDKYIKKKHKSACLLVREMLCKMSSVGMKYEGAHVL